MLDRRAVLAMFGKSMAACAGVLGAGSARGSLFNAVVRSSAAEQAGSTSAFETQLQADMTLLSKRVYSEEGIPMILVCEDLTAKTPVMAASRAMNVVIAPAFHRYVEAWQHLHPDAPVGDVAKLMELLAYRDFSGGGKDTNL